MHFLERLFGLVVWRHLAFIQGKGNNSDFTFFLERSVLKA